MKHFFFLLLMLSQVTLLFAGPVSDTLDVFQADSAHFCNTDSLFIDAGDGYISYSWSTGETSRGIWVTETNLYRAEVTDGSGNVYIDSVYVNLIIADIQQSDTTLCYGEKLSLSVRQKLPECQVAYFPFNGDTRDYSGNAQDGFAFGASLVPDRFGNPNSALEFNGKDQYLIATLRNIHSTFSLALWFTMPDTNQWSPDNEYPTLFDFGNGQAMAQILGKNEDIIHSGNLGKISLRHDIGPDSPDNYTFYSNSNPSFETWHHLYAVFNSAGLISEIWIDGILQGSFITQASLSPSGNQFIYFGRTESLGTNRSFFIGTIDEVNVFSCVLDPGQLHDLIESGSVFNYRYFWDTGDSASVITVGPEKSKTYTATVTDGLYACQDSVRVTVNPEINLELEQLDMGCPGEAKAKMLARASGGTAPYAYEWDPGIAFLQGDTLALGLTDSVTYSIIVRDSMSCQHDQTFEVEALPPPQVNFSYEPEDVYYQNPVVQFTSETDKAANWSWDFGDGEMSSLESPSHVFTEIETYHVVLSVTAENGCIDSLAQEINVQEVELVIPNIFTPNGDGINDTFIVTDLDKYISNSLVIFNRWGRRVFEANNYSSGDWDGDNLSDGTYYFILKCKGYFSTETFKGTLNIFTGGFR